MLYQTSQHLTTHSHGCPPIWCLHLISVGIFDSNVLYWLLYQETWKTLIRSLEAYSFTHFVEKPVFLWTTSGTQLKKMFVLNQTFQSLYVMINFIFIMKLLSSSSRLIAHFQNVLADSTSAPPSDSSLQNRAFFEEKDCIVQYSQYSILIQKQYV